jgi:hypothetical protein
MTVRRLMKILMAREKQRYGKSKLKDIQPLTDCAGVETMTSQSVPVMRVPRNRRDPSPTMMW